MRNSLWYDPGECCWRIGLDWRRFQERRNQQNPKKRRQTRRKSGSRPKRNWRNARLKRKKLKRKLPKWNLRLRCPELKVAFRFLSIYPYLHQIYLLFRGFVRIKSYLWTVRRCFSQVQTLCSSYFAQKVSEVCSLTFNSNSISAKWVFLRVDCVCLQKYFLRSSDQRLFLSLFCLFLSVFLQLSSSCVLCSGPAIVVPDELATGLPNGSSPSPPKGKLIVWRISWVMLNITQNTLGCIASMFLFVFLSDIFWCKYFNSIEILNVK